MQHRGCEEQAVEQVRRVQRGVRGLVDGFMHQLQVVEALAGAPEADRAALEGEMREARSGLLEAYWQVERQSTELGRLYAASCRLHGSRDAERVLDAIHEAACELLGCSRMALYELADPGGLSLVAAWGVAPENLPSRPALGSGPLGQAAAAGCPWVLDAPPSPVSLGGAPLWAAVPLFSGGRVRAILALLDALSPSADPHHVFELLAIHGGAALDGARLSRRVRALMAV